MRTIKFRGIWFEDGSWVYGNYVSKNQHICSCIDGHVTHVEHYDYIVNQDEIDNLKYHQVYPDTVCQFTGLLDKNGKEIYEGDLLRSDKYPYRSRDKESDNYFGLIEWNNNEAAFYIVTIKNPKYSIKGIFDGTSDYISQSALQDFEVIGNIYDDEWKQFREHL